MASGYSLYSFCRYTTFGSQMPGRSYSSPDYRFGYNGKENDIEHNEGIQNYGYRLSDARLGRFFTVDPLTIFYPELTPYQFASNRPIDGVDLDGLEWSYKANWVPGKAKPTLQLTFIVNMNMVGFEKYDAEFFKGLDIYLRWKYSTNSKNYVTSDGTQIIINTIPVFNKVANSSTGITVQMFDDYAPTDEIGSGGSTQNYPPAGVKMEDLKTAQNLSKLPTDKVTTQNAYIRAYTKSYKKGIPIVMSRNEIYKSIAHELGHTLFGFIHDASNGILIEEYIERIQDTDEYNLMKWGDYNTLDNLSPSQLMDGLNNIMNDLKSNVVPKGGSLNVAPVAPQTPLPTSAPVQSVPMFR